MSVYDQAMNRLLQVADTVDGIFVSMPEVLASLRPEASVLRWNILDLREVVPSEDSDLDLALIEQRVLDSPSGLEMSFAELTAFSNGVKQVIDGLFVGFASSDRFALRSDDDATIMEGADMLVAAIDSSFWLVGAPEDVLARVQRRLRAVSEVDAASMQLSTWGRD